MKHYTEWAVPKFVAARLDHMHADEVEAYGDGYSVRLVDAPTGFTVWVDVCVTASDIETDWNMYIFNTTDPAHVWRMAFQDYTAADGYAATADVCGSLAIGELCARGLIAQDARGGWHVVRTH